ncbi:hypothetical protein [Halogranum rubrum]|uniref:DUF7964 domain-containing protein n=1 Tax=Halogranum salarium B-1 TaxID=1210908 RepID=J2ZYI1_9EURY|nr:hypothetical protein [Halogranum salarium]EJN58073.1 hypothetical protein HSB1_34900 [Halogranum salarium B-1]
MTLLDSLPARPLTLDEGEDLALSDTVAPLTVLTADADSHRRGVYTLFVTSSEASRAFVAGFDPEQQRWTVVDSWDEDEWTPTKQEEALAAFVEEHYGDVEQEHMRASRGVESE